MRKKLLILSLGLILVFVVTTVADRGDNGESRATLRGPGPAFPGETPPEIADKAGAVVWDNGMDYSYGIAASQDDPISGLDPIVADDFMFSVDQNVNDVHWIAGYWNGPPDDGDFDWEITFYNDVGDGAMPGTVIATYTFANANTNETWIAGSPGSSNFHSCSVDLPATLSFAGGVKYWISIQGVGAYPPQSGWAGHTTIILHEAVFKSTYFGFPTWTNSSSVFGVAIDMAFQLTYGEECSWNPGDPHKMHYPQLPDEAGWDVNATQPLVLADDWMCSETGWVKDIHWWGSWLDGIEGEILYFVLSIHDDIPADQNPAGYSMPGTTLWEFEFPGFPGTPKDPPTAEGWYDPSTGFFEHPNHQAYFQYDVCLEEPFWFWQDSGTIYWLNISAVVAGGGTTYTPGDVDGNGLVDQADVNYLTNYIFAGGPPPPYDVGGFYPAADADGDCAIAVGDINYLVQYLSGGPAPRYCPQYPPVASGPQWGWKSTQDHWNDDAVWAYWGDLAWVDMYEPGGGSAGPINNDFLIMVDEAGAVLQAAGSDHFGDGWYYYPTYDWWNIWFYDHPFDFTRYKTIHLEFDVWPYNPGAPASFELAINWGTDAWYNDQSDSTPPLPYMVDPSNEDLYIGRLPVFQAEEFGGHYVFDLELPWYNPEWISIDVRGFNYNLDGWIIHDCVGDQVSLDLAFVITGDAPPVESGACCFDDGSCQELPAAECASLGGTYMGDGSNCEGDINPPNGIDDACEDPPFGACCFADGSCLVMNPVDCANKGGTYQGDGTPCLGDVNPANGIDDACETGPFGACCFTDGSCNVLSAADCASQGGNYLGDNIPCQGDNNGNGIDDACEDPTGACCYQDGSCAVLSAVDCAATGGTYQGDGTDCTDADFNGTADICEDPTGACCFADGSCQEVTAVDCAALGGSYKGDYTHCLGDSDGNGIDDACEPGWQVGDGHKMHYPQLPDEAGWDVNATYPLVLADDWMCSDTGWVKDFHFWGSWKHGEVGNILNFVLSIHSDIPASQNPAGYSMPGELLWEYQISEFNSIPINPPTMEGWYDPSTGDILYNDHQEYFQYNIYLLDSLMWFWQDSGTVYWLNISAVLDPTGVEEWGWKSSSNHWNDDAVWSFYGEYDWQDLYEPGTDSLSTTNAFMVVFDEFGNFMDGYGDSAYGEGWYYYPWYDWWNVWFYDHPFDSTRYKTIHLEFDINPWNPGAPSWVEIAVNWSTDRWSLDQPPSDSAPPLPGVDEDLYIGREILYSSDFPEGHVVRDYIIPYYNPEWISIDVRGFNFMIPGGWIEHACVGRQSMDLSFVITGGDEFECDCWPGNANGDAAINILDITYIIAYLYKGGPPPTPYQVCSGDANCDCTVNLLDATFLIMYLYYNGTPPCDCPTWVANCGSPLY